MTERSYCFAVSAIFILAIGPYVFAQNQPVNTVLRGRWNQYAGVAGELTTDGNYIYGGNCGRCDDMEARVFVVDITNPSNPTLANEVLIPPPNNFCSPEDIMLSDGLLFLALESNQNDAVAIFDARNPPALPLLTTVRLNGYDRAHNVQYHEGFLYVCGVGSTVGIADLRTLDPDNPPPSPFIDDHWTLMNVGSPYVHEILPITLPAPYGKVLYCAAWDGGLRAYDIDNVATSMPTLLGTAPGQSTHSMWPTSDGKFVVSGEERFGGGIKVWEVTVNSPTSWSFTLRDTLTMNSEAYCVHNQYVVGHRLFNSWYQAGMQVHDIDPVTGLLSFVASYDTSVLQNSGTYAGNWSVWPFAGEDRVVLSDMQSGYFVVEVGQPLFTISTETIERIDPQNGAELQVSVMAASATPDPRNAHLHYTVDNGPVQTVSLMTTNGVDFTGQFGSQPCGSEVRYWVEVHALGDRTASVKDPLDAPAGYYTVPVARAIVPIVSYNFEVSTGWSISGNAVDGHWQVGIPNGGGFAGDPMSDFDGSGRCFVTENGTGNTDVDAGSTILTSPTFNLSQLTDPVVSYARWFSNSNGAAVHEDTFVVQLSNNGGSSWTNLEVVGPTGVEVAGGWFFRKFHVDDFLSPTAMMRFRFTASDSGIPSIIEAAIDAFKVEEYACEIGSCCVGLACTNDVVPLNCTGDFRSEVSCDVPCPCVSNAQCDDGVFCNGVETCVDGTCVSGPAPCIGANQLCDEDNDVCLAACVLDADCRFASENNACNCASCSSGVCQFTCTTFGNIDCDQQNQVNLDDILCSLMGFQGAANCANADIYPCGGDGLITLDDILAVLSAFAGANPCACTENSAPGTGVPALCGSTQP